jgi:hypothetical protein
LKAFAKNFFLIMAMSGCAVAARADVLYYKCGEADPGAANGVTATNSNDSAGINNLLLLGGPVYSSDHAACDTNSSLSLQFNGSNFGLAYAFVVTNFTAEVWVKPESDSTYATIFYDGNGEYDYYADYYGINDLDGWGFLQEGNTFTANLKVNIYGDYDLGSTPVVTNVWTHLALVCTNGVAMFLVNGQTNTIANVTPIPSTEYLNVGGWSDGSAGFVGLIDDAKVSMSLPLTLTASWSRGQVALYWPSTYPNYCVQYVTNLVSTNWTSVSEETTLIQGELTLTNVSTDAARFYRLAPAGPPVPVVYVHITAPGGYEYPVYLITFNDTLPLIDEASGGLDPCGMAFDGSIICDLPSALFASDTNTFDASASVDPRSIGNGSHSYQWDIFASKEYGSAQIVSTNINFNSPVLTIPPNSMPTLPLIPSDPASPYYLVRLTIQHQPYDSVAVPSEQTIVWFRYMYLQSNFGG